MDAAEVLVVVYDGVQFLDAAGPVEVFDGATRALGGGGYRVRLASAGGRDVLTSSGVRLGVHADLSHEPAWTPCWSRAAGATPARPRTAS